MLRYNEAIVNWGLAENADKYTLYLAIDTEDSTGDFNAMETSASTGQKVNVTRGNKYRFKVQPSNSCGPGLFSPESSLSLVGLPG
jgi:hypothetical protein